MSWHDAYAGLTDRGRVRERNEDCWTADPEIGLYLVVDGMGGHVAGELAARSVVETLPRLIRQRLNSVARLSDPDAAAMVKRAICELSSTLYEQSHDQPGLAGMGATVVLALVREGQALVAHMGDSRAYLIRPGRFDQLTHDHSMVQVLVDNEEISPDAAEQHSAHGQVTRHVGMAGAPLPEARGLDLRDGDRLLLCTDGLTDMLVDAHIMRIFEENENPSTICRALIDAANTAGGRDNVTAVIIESQQELDA